MVENIEGRSPTSSDLKCTVKEVREDQDIDDDLYIMAKDIEHGLLIHGVKRG
jgi:hypothetical protein